MGFCASGMYLLSMLPINSSPLMHLYSLAFKQHQLLFIRKVFPDCEIDSLEFINFRLRHLLPKAHSRSRWGVLLKQIIKSILMDQIFAFRLGSISLVQHQLAGLKIFLSHSAAAKNKIINSPLNFVHIDRPRKIYPFSTIVYDVK